jgi:hypothetical protein
MHHGNLCLFIPSVGNRCSVSTEPGDAPYNIPQMSSPETYNSAVISPTNGYPQAANCQPIQRPLWTSRHLEIKTSTPTVRPLSPSRHAASRLYCTVPFSLDLRDGLPHVVGGWAPSRVMQIMCLMRRRGPGGHLGRVLVHASKDSKAPISCGAPRTVRNIAAVGIPVPCLRIQLQAAQSQGEPNAPAGTGRDKRIVYLQSNRQKTSLTNMCFLLAICCFRPQARLARMGREVSIRLISDARPPLGPPAPPVI